MGVAVRRSSHGRMSRFGVGGLGATLPDYTSMGITWKLVNGNYMPIDANGNNVMGIYGFYPASVITTTQTGATGGSGATGGTATATAPVTVKAGVIYSFQDYMIQIVSIGSGALSGFVTADGLAIPIGTVWIIASGPGAGETWGADAVNHSTQITAGSTLTTPPPPPPPPSPGTQKTDLVEHIAVDSNGNLTWSFDPAAPPPYEIAYSPAGSNNWTDVVPTPAPQSGQVALNLAGGQQYIIVMHAGGIEVARTTYLPAAPGAPPSILAPATPIDTTTGITAPASTGFFSSLTSGPEWINGIPNILTGIGAVILGVVIVPQLLKKR